MKRLTGLQYALHPWMISACRSLWESSSHSLQSSLWTPAKHIAKPATNIMQSKSENRDRIHWHIDLSLSPGPRTWRKLPGKGRPPKGWWVKVQPKAKEIGHGTDGEFFTSFFLDGGTPKLRIFLLEQDGFLDGGTPKLCFFFLQHVGNPGNAGAWLPEVDFFHWLIVDPAHG